MQVLIIFGLMIALVKGFSKDQLQVFVLVTQKSAVALN